jgi:hypothetical protein
MIALRRRLLFISGLFAVLLGGSALADSDGDSWWPRWEMGGGMMRGGWEGDGEMMGYAPIR